MNKTKNIGDSKSSIDIVKDLNKSVLVVEDSRLVADAIKIILEASGIHVEHTDEGAKVNDLAKKLRSDLIILDLMMPGMDGYEVFSRLKSDKDTKTLPVIILSAKADALKWDENIRSCDKFIPKPFDNAVLVAEVKRLLKI